jgi:hypothetical protein
MFYIGSIVLSLSVHSVLDGFIVGWCSFVTPFPPIAILAGTDLIVNMGIELEQVRQIIDAGNAAIRRLHV